MALDGAGAVGALKVAVCAVRARESYSRFAPVTTLDFDVFCYGPKISFVSAEFNTHKLMTIISLYRDPFWSASECYSADQPGFLRVPGG